MVGGIPNPVECKLGYWIVPMYFKNEYDTKDVYHESSVELEERFYWMCTYTGKEVDCGNCPLK